MEYRNEVFAQLLRCALHLVRCLSLLFSLKNKTVQLLQRQDAHKASHSYNLVLHRKKLATAALHNGSLPL